MISVTGGTGFIGRRIVAGLRADGARVRALVRRDGSGLANAGVEVLRGSLDDGHCLAALVDGATAVVHCAGVIKASGCAIFYRVNRDGTARLAEVIAAAVDRPRLVLMSSLAAREPALSSYADSKRLGEEAVRRTLGSASDHCIVRPPAVYGPGDRATLPIFRQLQRGLLLVPAGSTRFSLLYVDDLVEIVATLLQAPRVDGAILEPDDGSGGYGWADLSRIAGERLGRRVRTVPVPKLVAWPLALVGQVAGAVSARGPSMTVGKVREFYHPDWVCRNAGDPPWGRAAAPVTFENGFATTLAWYKQHGWL